MFKTLNKIISVVSCYWFYSFCYNIQKENKENLSIFTDSSCRKDKFWCLHQNPPQTLYSYNVQKNSYLRERVEGCKRFWCLHQNPWADRGDIISKYDITSTNTTR